MATKKRTARLRLKRDTLRVLSPAQVLEVRGGNNGNGYGYGKNLLYIGATKTNSPNETRYCQ